MATQEPISLPLARAEPSVVCGGDFLGGHLIAGPRPRGSTRRRPGKGMDGRDGDNPLIRERLGWEPAIPAHDGVEKTGGWIYDEMQKTAG